MTLQRSRQDWRRLLTSLLFFPQLLHSLRPLISLHPIKPSLPRPLRQSPSPLNSQTIRFIPLARLTKLFASQKTNPLLLLVNPTIFPRCLFLPSSPPQTPSTPTPFNPSASNPFLLTQPTTLSSLVPLTSNSSLPTRHHLTPPPLPPSPKRPTLSCRVLPLSLASPFLLSPSPPV